MASGAFTVARGRINALMQRVVDGTPANSGLVIVALAQAEADSVLKTHRDLASLLAAAGNAEATNTGYSRLLVNPGNNFGIAADVQDFADRAFSTFDAISWSSVATGDDWVKALICYDPDTTSGDDSAIIPLTHHQFIRNPRGGAVSLRPGGSRNIPGWWAFYIASKD